MTNIRELINIFSEPQTISVFDRFKKFPAISISGAGNSSSKAFIVSDLMRFSDEQPVVWIVNDKVEQDAVANACRDWYSPTIDVITFDPPEDDEDEARSQTLYMLKALLDGERKVIIAPYTVFMRDMPDPGELAKKTLTVRKGEKVSNVELFEKLIAQGYQVSNDDYLERGTYLGKGDVLTVFPVNGEVPARIEFEFDTVADIFEYSQDTGDIVRHLKTLSLYPLNIEFKGQHFFEFINGKALTIDDELEVTDEHFEAWDEIFAKRDKATKLITFTSFPEDAPYHCGLRYLSVLKYQDLLDLSHDLKEKSMQDWRVIFFTKHADTMKGLLDDKKVVFSADLVPFGGDASNIRVIDVPKEDVLPHSFQSADEKLLVLSDKEIANIREEKQHKKVSERVFWEFLTTLKPNDLVVHINHGIARFDGLDRRMVDGITREYMKLGYAENDKLFVPIDQADKVNKFVGAEEDAPKLTRLGSVEWATLTKRVRKETESIARELLELYAKRKRAAGIKFTVDTPDQKKFEESFPYDETPGQIKAIEDVKHDMEKDGPMDRLVCGDVGFGKTEVAMRAAFKSVAGGKQVAVISPITILADQHYRSFQKRMEPFNIRVDMLSRFRSQKEQKVILGKLARGEIDVIIGTHRLLQKDIAFKDLGLVIIDEEQRFGVKQKEQLKKLRTEVHMLTLTATPIPRTLNICLNKLRDISTITTPPPGRLPV
ncbi:MAG: Transcription-repair coupling factor, partial [Candidatus Peregrinibacteria bacterium GW2011_GWA2_47_7]